MLALLNRQLKQGRKYITQTNRQSIKKYSRKGKLNGKNSCKPINPKKYSYKAFENEKNFCSYKILHPPPPPHNFSNPSLILHALMSVQGAF